MKKLHWLFIMPMLAILAFASSCAKEGGNCITNSGTVIRQARYVGDFDSIAVYDFVDVFIRQDTLNAVEIEAGQNIISGITTRVENRKLILRNLNECNWLRSYNKPINVHVAVKNLRGIYYESSGNVTSVNTITSPLLALDVWGGCGTIDLELNLYEGFFIQHMGTADIRLRGNCSISSIYAGDYGPVRCDELQTGYTFINNYSSNDCYVRASQYLEATIGSIGNIYYTGNPDTLKTHILGSGAVIPMNP